MTDKKLMLQVAPWPDELEQAVKELRYLPRWRFWLTEESRGQDCNGLTLNIIPDKLDSYHQERYANTRFLYPVPAAAFNRDSWEEWLWARIEETEAHERAEWFKFVDKDGNERRPFKPIHADGWDPGFIRKIVPESVADIPNAGRIVKFPCKMCGHDHKGRMGERFTIKTDNGCVNDDCTCEEE